MTTTQRFPRWIGVWLCVALAGSEALAQSDTGPSSTRRNAPRGPSNFGLQGSVLTIGAVSFVPTESNAECSYDGNGSKYATSPSGVTLAASVNIPTGASISVIQFEVYDNDPTGDVTMTALACGGDPAGAACSPLGSIATSDSPGWGYQFFVVSGITVDNLTNQYLVEVTLPSDGGTTAFRRVMIFYQLQVSPAPVAATFNDVPTTDPGFQYIEALAASRITGGCGGGNYCPDNPVTRRQMAVFLAKALGLYWPN